MRSKILYFLIFFISLTGYQNTFAQMDIPRSKGIVGMELNYDFLGNNSAGEIYRVNLTIYADCSFNTNNTNEELSLSQPKIRVLQDGNNYNLMKLHYNSLSSADVSPVCIAEAGNTSCLATGSVIPGIKKIVFSNAIILAGKSAEWRFRFLGEGLNAMRSQLVGNVITLIPLALGATEQIYIEANLDNTQGPNSAPEFVSPGAPYFCVNKPATYNMAASEPDGDSLVYSLGTPKVINEALITAPAHDAVYVPPYTAQAPLPASNFVLNTQSALMSFTPELPLQCIVVGQIDEYRNGVKIGSTRREMLFSLADACNNDAPGATFSNVTNAESSIDARGNLTLTTCEGQTTNYGFQVNGNDINGDNVKISFDNLPTGATISVDSTVGPSPVARFTGNNNELKGGSYIFYVTITDEACPIVASKTMLCTLKVVPHNVVFEKGSTPSCVGSAIGNAWAVPSRDVHTIYNYKWVNKNGTTVRQENSASGDTLRNVPAGNYKVYIRNDQGCGTNVVMNVDVINIPVVSLPNDTTICDRMPMTLSIVQKPYESYKWNTGSTECCIRVPQTGIYAVTATNICGSTTGEIKIDMIKCNYCLFIPNAFSPNGDGNNDVFKIIPTCMIAQYKLQIYNRMGDMIYVSYKLSDSWDGTYNGQQADIGTYYYHITATPEDDRKNSFVERGAITLIR